MSKARRIAASNEIRCHIKFISEASGGDDPVWLKEYIDEVLTTWEHDLDKALECFRDLRKQAEGMGRHGRQSKPMGKMEQEKES
jgi:hypothetical protein